MKIAILADDESKLCEVLEKLRDLHGNELTTVDEPHHKQLKISFSDDYLAADRLEALAVRLESYSPELKRLKRAARKSAPKPEKRRYSNRYAKS